MRVDKGRLIIDVSEIDQSSYEALMYFAQDNAHTNIGKLINEWIDYVAWDVAAWYISDDMWFGEVIIWKIHCDICGKEIKSDSPINKIWDSELFIDTDDEYIEMVEE